MPETTKALVWDQTGEKLYETGVEKVVLYPIDTTNTTPSNPYNKGYAWNGVTACNESPSGADPTDLFANNRKYLTLRAAENFGMTIEAYTCPDQWFECDGSKALIKGVNLGQQARRTFGLAYTTKVGNDLEATDYGEKIHLVYGATASPSSRDYATINDSPEAITMSWELQATPVDVGTIGGVEYKPTASITINTKDLTEAQLTAITNALYGTETTDPYLPLPSALYALLTASEDDDTP